jgi:hypothetical protein
MPIPSPTDNEKKDAFISRCMGDGVMKKEFPEAKQRVAVCMSKWKNKNKKKASVETPEEDKAFFEGFLEKHPEYKEYFEEVNNGNG